jgi:hypothetical protein
VNLSVLDTPIGVLNMGANVTVGIRSMQDLSTLRLMIVRSSALATTWSIVERVIG